MKSRYFNNVNIENNTFVKSSKNIQKIVDEYVWFKELPQRLKKYIPKMVDLEIKNDTAYMKMQNIIGKNYAELYLAGELSNKDIKNALKLLNKIGSYKADNGFDIHKYASFIYKDKTMERINKLEDVPFVYKLLGKQTLINDKKYPSLKLMLKKMRCWIDYLISTAKPSLIHGDYCFNNLIKESETGIIKMVDARGRALTQTNCGDIRYDLAKFRHSINGLYDFIVYNKYELNIDDTQIRYTIEKPENYEKLCNDFDNFIEKLGYDLQEIKLIEALLFLTMIPLHKDDNNRQIMFYITGITKLYEVIYGQN